MCKKGIFGNYDFKDFFLKLKESKKGPIYSDFNLIEQMEGQNYFIAPRLNPDIKTKSFKGE